MTTKIYYLGQYNNKGSSQLLNLGSNNETIKKDAEHFKTLVTKYLPEGQRVHKSKKEWLMDNTINILNDTEVSITFISEGAGYKNTLGYYIYQTINPPKTIRDINEVYIIFPNCSDKPSGGNLETGDTMLLAFSFNFHNNNIVSAKNYIFPPGYSIGFILYPDGWNNIRFNKNLNTAYSSISFHNPEKIQELKYHTVCIKSNEYDNLLIGFEDLNRETAGCDHDFNDCVFIINTNILSIAKTYVEPENIEPVITGYKKILSRHQNKIVECVAELHIPISSTIIKKPGNNKIYKTNRAKVINIIVVKPVSELFSSNFTGVSLTEGYSLYDSSFIYKVNSTITSSLEDNHGIYFHYKFIDASSYMI